MSKGINEKRIIIDGPVMMSEEDREFINEKNLSSADMFRIHGIIAGFVLGMKITGYNFNPEECQTTIFLE